MSQKIVVLGASGHAKVISDIIIKTGNELVGYLDDGLESGKIILTHGKNEYKVLGKIKKAIQLLQNNQELKFIIAIGNNIIREKLSNEYKLPYTTLIHPSANIGIGVEIDSGTVVMPNATINTGAKIGRHCIINTGAIVEHDNKLEDYVHISPNATLAGTVKVGKCTHIGVGATVKNNITITDNCIIGAGAVVVKNIDKEGVYVGVPARLLKEKNIQ